MADSVKIDISIVIPAYNEALRLPAFLDRVAAYCRSSAKIYEIIVVDDGSRDMTAKAIESYREKFSSFQIIVLNQNRGKGYAVKRGLLAARGAVRLFMDADGSVEPQEIEKNIRYLEGGGQDIFIGSRVLRDPGRVLKVRLHRKLVGTVFNFFIRTFLFKNVKDTQCGFKMFKQEAVEPLFARSYLDGFGFDAEILYLAYKMGYKVKEGPVSWHHVSDSKVNLFKDSLKMFVNILQIRNWHCTPINPSCEYMGPDEYDYMYNLENYHWWFVSRRNLAIHIIESFGLREPLILDIGAGTGGNMAAFNRLGKVFGIDASSKAVDYCRRRGLKDVTQGLADDLSFPDKTFDIVVCMDLLEHVTDPVKVLAQAKRVLKDDGKIVIMVPAFKWLWSQHDEALCHLRRYEKPSLQQDLSEAGLKVQKMTYFFFTSFFAVLPIRLTRRLLVSKNKKRFSSDTTTLPPKPLNQLLKAVFNLETGVSFRWGLPLGTTIYGIVSKSGGI